MTTVTELFKQPPVLTSDALAWRGVRVEQYRTEAVEIPAHYHSQHLLIIFQVPTSVLVRHERGSQVQEHAFSQDELGLYPGGEYSAVTCSAACDNIYLTVDDQHLEQLARQAQDQTKFALHNRFHFNDPLLLHLGRQLVAAVGRGHALGLLYVESLTNALCHQLIEHYATRELRMPKRTPVAGQRTGSYRCVHRGSCRTVHHAGNHSRVGEPERISLFASV